MPQLGLHQLAEFLERRQIVEVPGHDDGGHHLAPLVVGPADHRDLADSGMGLDEPLDRLGPDVLAARDDHLVGTTVDGHEARGAIDRPDVAVWNHPPASKGSVLSR